MGNCSDPIISNNVMKTKPLLFTFLLLSIFFSCIQPNDNKDISVVVNDTLQTNIDKTEKERLEKREGIEKQDYEDSISLAKALVGALKIATLNIEKEKFQNKYEVISDSISVNVEINLDYHFTKKYPHLIIRRHGPNAVYIDIYNKNDRKFEKVVSHEQWVMTYVNDTIRDVNGDGLNDFVVNWYGATGCCLKAFSNVYLLRQNKNEFSNNFEFINPTFSPKEKIIRGVCYGHPGETEMYKYKWNEEMVDTIEYVGYEKNDSGKKTGKIVISNTSSCSNTFKVLKRLNSVPNEYKKIEGYDWFTGKGYE